MKNMKVAAPAAAAAANAVPGYTREQHIQALAPLNAAIANLGAARGRLDSLAADARGIHPKLHSNFWKQGSKKHHNSAHKKKIDKMESHVYNNLENRLPGITTDLKNAHAAIPPAIDAVRTAHENLRRQHPALAEKSGKPGKKQGKTIENRRKFSENPLNHASILKKVVRGTCSAFTRVNVNNGYPSF